VTWTHFAKTVSVQLIYCIVSTAAWFTGWYIYVSVCNLVVDDTFSQKFFYGSFSFVIPLILLNNMIFVLIHYVILFIEKNRLASEEILSHKLLLAEAELKALKNTIHPHFLFNSLSMLQSLVKTAPDTASEALASLSEFLLYSVQFSQKNEVSIADEIAHVKHYIAIELLRRGHSFTVRWNVDQSCNDCLVIPFILQPLVENAIKHGIETGENGEIDITLSTTADRIIFTVVNTVCAATSHYRTSGTGLVTLTKRISAAFGSAARLTTQQRDNKYSATITVPLKRSIADAN